MIIPHFEALPEPEPEGVSGLATIFQYCYRFMHDSCSITYNGFTFNLWDVFVTVIVFSIIGYILGKLLNPFSREYWE